MLLPSAQPSIRNMSFNAKTGEQASAQPMWDNSVYSHMQNAQGSYNCAFAKCLQSSSLILDAGSHVIGKVSNRALSFIGHEADRSGPDVAQKQQAIVVVDPFSTGALLAKQCYEAGYKVIQMFSIWNSPVASLVELGLVVEYSASLQFNDMNPNKEEALCNAIDEINALPCPIIAVIPGAETGKQSGKDLRLS